MGVTARTAWCRRAALGERLSHPMRSDPEPRRSRADWHCRACGRRGRLDVDVHHVIKRSRGGSDFDLDRLVALCRTCHDQTDAPLAAGRLMVTPLGAGQFAFTVVHGPAKYRWPASLDRAYG
jgi:5-methylcytosine-specific restriction endonuclease McrA